MEGKLNLEKDVERGKKFEIIFTTPSGGEITPEDLLWEIKKLGWAKTGYWIIFEGLPEEGGLQIIEVKAGQDPDFAARDCGGIVKAYAKDRAAAFWALNLVARKI
jgi:hypothetical protein